MLAAGPLPEVMTDDLLSQTLEIKVSVGHRQGRWQVMVEQE